MQTPVVVVSGGVVVKVLYFAEPFFGPDGIQHPAEAWSLWAAEDWARMCPGWTMLPLIDTPTSEAGKRAEPRPMAQWTVGTDAVEVTYRMVDLTPAEIEAKATSVEAARTAAVAANNVAAGRAREAYLTAVPGQAATYAAKQAEMQRWIAAGRPDDATAAAYPWAGDRADLRAVSVAAVLAEWEVVTEAWETVGRQIERERERVNEAITAAGSPEAIQAARDSAVYPSP